VGKYLPYFLNFFYKNFFDLPFYFAWGVFPKTTNRLSQFKCKAPFVLKFKNGVVPHGWGQINKAFMNLITN